MKKQWLVVAIIVVVLTAGAVLALTFKPDLFPVEVGTRAPAFHAIDLASGDSVSLDTYKGQVVLLNVWATWCEPCRIEMPSMERLQQTMAPNGLKIVAVSIDKSTPEVVKAFQRQYGLTFTILQDRPGGIQQIYQTTGVPESFVINREGTIVKKVVGPEAWDNQAVRSLLARLLAQPGA